MEALEQYIARDIFPATEALSTRLLASQSRKSNAAHLPDATHTRSKCVFEISVTFLELLGKKATDLLQVAAGNGDVVAKEVPIMENKVRCLKAQAISI